MQKKQFKHKHMNFVFCWLTHMQYSTIQTQTHVLVFRILLTYTYAKKTIQLHANTCISYSKLKLNVHISDYFGFWEHPSLSIFSLRLCCTAASAFFHCGHTRRFHAEHPAYCCIFCTKSSNKCTRRCHGNQLAYLHFHTQRLFDISS